MHADNPHGESGFLDAVIERVREGVCVCHDTAEFPHVSFSVWNPRMTEITGDTQEEINGCGWYQTLYPDSAVQARAKARKRSMVSLTTARRCSPLELIEPRH